MINISKNPSFAFDALKMQVNVVYYICPVAGDDDGSGLVNLQSACKDAKGGTPVRFLAPPVISFTHKSEICQGSNITLNFSATGSPGKTVRFTLVRSDDPSNPINLTAPTGGSTQQALTPDGSSAPDDSVRFWILGGSVQYSTAPNCSGTWQGDTGRVKVNPAPSAAIISPKDFVLCDGDSIQLNFTTAGNGTITVGYRDLLSGNNFSFSSAETPLVQRYAKPSGSGVHTYVITQVSGTTSANVTCPGTFSDTARIELRNNPDAGIDANPKTICFGQSTDLNFTHTDNFAPYRFTYHTSNNPGGALRFNVRGADTTFSRSPSATVTYTLDSVSDATISSATGKACRRAIGRSVTVTVNQLPMADISKDQEICFGDSALITIDFTGSAAGAAPYTAIYADMLTSTPVEDSMVSAAYTINRYEHPTDTARYQLIRVYDSFGCIATRMTGGAYVPVNPIPVPLVAASDTSSCPPLVTTLMNLTEDRFLGNWKWSFGDGTFASGSGPDRGQDKVYDQAGSYTIRLEVTSPQGCYKDTILPDFLTVNPFPVADFSWEPNPTTFAAPYVSFRNSSALGDNYNWQYFTSNGDTLGGDSIFEPSFEFPAADTGSYPVRLITTTDSGCADTAIHVVYIGGELIVYAPNSFTPNGDGINDVFLPVITGFDLESYELWIFDRWGETVFHSTNSRQGWDGRFTGVEVKSDTYAFRLKVRSKYSAAKQEVIGKITVLR
jgi:gliding motility-associated-like protein